MNKNTTQAETIKFIDELLILCRTLKKNKTIYKMQNQKNESQTSNSNLKNPPNLLNTECQNKTCSLQVRFRYSCGIGFCNKHNRNYQRFPNFKKKEMNRSDKLQTLITKKRNLKKIQQIENSGNWVTHHKNRCKINTQNQVKPNLKNYAKTIRNRYNSRNQEVSFIIS
jgi:hypothetical protein